MPHRSDFVTWGQIGLLLTVLSACVAGGFAWMHSDISEARRDITAVNSSVLHVGDQIGDVKQEIGTTNGKLDVLIQEMRFQKEPKTPSK